MNYAIVTDSCSNLSDKLIEQYDINILPMIYIVNGEEKLSYSKDTPTNLKQYYDLMRNKTPMSTSCVCTDNCVAVFEPLLQKGLDVLYIGFSSALSATFEVAKNTLNELTKKYPERKAFSVDSLSASLGQGLLVTSVAKQRENGMSINSAYDWAEDNKLKLCHLFTVDNLSYLYRGGRVKKSAFLLATTLNIKPVMNVDNGGRLVAIGKVFGRKASLNNIAQRLASTITNSEQQTIYVGHGDCIEDAEYLISRVKELVNIEGVEINYIDLVIGTHSGPGTVAIFYYGQSRDTK